MLILVGAQAAVAAGSGDHEHGPTSTTDMLRNMERMHEGHEHAHDFAAMEGVSEEDMHRTIDFFMDIGLVVPPMDSERGALVFMEKGCVVCHSVNGVGGEIGPSFNATDMPQPMNAFEFAARMWRGAPAMAQMQHDLFGEMINLNGQELADVIAFVHDAHVQSHITATDIPEQFIDLIP